MMRLFQNSGVSRSYRKHLSRLTKGSSGFVPLRDAFLADRYGASHLLKPILDGEPDSFFTNGDDFELQRAWARENGLNDKIPLDEILLAQIEEHNSEVFYNLDPVRYPSTFLRRLPGSVRHKLCWRAAPSGSVDFSGYDRILCNFPTILESYTRNGWNAAYFFPAHDPELDCYAENGNRPIDVIFVGGYSQYHVTRAALLETIAARAEQLKIVYHLDRSRLTALSETPLGWFGPLRQHRRPVAIRRVSSAPVFGRDLYRALSRARIVLNGAIDMAGPDRGNMRCFEAMGAGACLVSDAGNYPEGMVDGTTMRTYETPEMAALIVQELIDGGKDRDIAASGHEMVSRVYNKERQWICFQELI